MPYLAIWEGGLGYGWKLVGEVCRWGSILGRDVTYVRQLDVAVGDASNLSSGTRHGLDANTIVGVHDLRVEDLDSVDDVVVTAANGSNRQTVTA
jgi:hypothetical protein